MKLLFIGGTGVISSACAELAVSRGHELTLVNRSLGKKYPAPPAAELVAADVRVQIRQLTEVLAGRSFDAVVDFIAFTQEDIERDLALFRGKTEQFVFISSASAYQKPPQSYLITEDTPLENPFWQYGRDKIACEERLMKAYREEGFPATIIRPSYTYGPSLLPLCVGSSAHPWTLVRRMQEGKKVIVPGDGTSLWVLTWNADFAKGLVGLLGRQEAVGEAFHITSDEVLTWNQIYAEAFRALGLEPAIVHLPADVIAAYWPHAHGSLLGDKIHSVVFDNRKVRSLVPDFACEVPWAEGVRRALSWFEGHPEFQTIDAGMDQLLDEMVLASERAMPRS